MGTKFALLLRTLAGWLEMLVGCLLLGLMFLALAGHFGQNKLLAVLHDPAGLSAFLSSLSTLVIGVEFVRMLGRHTVGSVAEIVCLAIARQMLIEHLTYPELLLSAAAIAVACRLLPPHKRFGK